MAFPIQLLCIHLFTTLTDMIIYTTNDRATRKAEEEAEKKRLEEEKAATE